MQLISVKEMRDGMIVGVTVRVSMMDKVRTVLTKYGEKKLQVLRLADDTGTIEYVTWDDEVGTYQLGERLKMQNCRVAIGHDGKLQLRTTPYSRITVISSKPYRFD